jgi:hypothetical protein
MIQQGAEDIDATAYLWKPRLFIPTGFLIEGSNLRKVHVASLLKKNAFKHIDIHLFSNDSSQFHYFCFLNDTQIIIVIHIMVSTDKREVEKGDSYLYMKTGAKELEMNPIASWLGSYPVSGDIVFASIGADGFGQTSVQTVLTAVTASMPSDLWLGDQISRYFLTLPQVYIPSHECFFLIDFYAVLAGSVIVWK